ncbi:MAG TPA: hypothetical protein PLL54_09040 [Dermatophilaceae bacterium]|jgi:hypothetical protein|nr:hypothetical protein [Dermatophilaceae bacterium]
MSTVATLQARSTWNAPTITGMDRRDEAEAEWSVAGAVAAFLGIAVGVVIYICSVCQARSFWSCVNAVRNYWTRGC